jgi:hypothetical protein
MTRHKVPAAAPAVVGRGGERGLVPAPEPASDLLLEEEATLVAAEDAAAADRRYRAPRCGAGSDPMLSSPPR